MHNKFCLRCRQNCTEKLFEGVSTGSVGKLPTELCN